ncbi:MAG TPA: hypothetical protein VL527_19630 [Dongiaceae bacterium]|jgi:hypothetical protein|nr:hypothetical protein [Dongiaceae bacterium]
MSIARTQASGRADTGVGCPILPLTVSFASRIVLANSGDFSKLPRNCTGYA